MSLHAWVLILALPAVTSCDRREPIRVTASLDLDASVFAAVPASSGSTFVLGVADGVYVVTLDKQGVKKNKIEIPGCDINAVCSVEGSYWAGGIRRKGPQEQQGVIFHLDFQGKAVEETEDTQFAEVYSMVYLPRRKVLVTGHANGEIIFWDIIGGQQQAGFGDFDIEVFSLSYSQDEEFLYVGKDGGEIAVWNVSTRKKVKSIQTQNQSTFVLKRMNTMDEIVTGGSSGILTIYSADLLKQRSIDLRMGSILSVDTQSSDELILCGLTDGDVALVNNMALASRRYRMHKSAVRFVHFLEAGNQILSVDEHGTIKIWNAPISDW